VIDNQSMNYKMSARVILYMNYTQILYDILYTCTHKQGNTTEGNTYLYIGVIRNIMYSKSLFLYIISEVKYTHRLYSQIMYMVNTQVQAQVSRAHYTLIIVCKQLIQQC